MSHLSTEKTGGPAFPYAFQHEDDMRFTSSGHTKTFWPIGTRIEIMAGGTAPMARGIVIGYGRKPFYIRIKRDDLKTPETWPCSLCRMTLGDL